MRIAYVINSVEGGGAAAPVPAVCDLLRRHGAEVAVFALTGRDGRGLPAMKRAGLEVRVRAGGGRDHLGALRWLDRELAGWRPDVVWTSLTRATLLGQIVGGRLGAPVVSWQHAAYLKPANRLLLFLRRRASALWLADSECVAALTRRRLRVPADRLITWPLFAVDPAAPGAAPWRPGTPVRIGSLGRLHPVKGFDVLVEAVALLREAGFRRGVSFEVEIAGEGGQRPTLERLIARRGLLNVRLAGFTADPKRFLSTLHVYVQPSRSEGLCIAVHEAMQAGLPTIGTAVGEMPHSIHPGLTGLVVPPGNVEALAVALAELLRVPERLQAMGEAARERLAEKLGARAFEEAGAGVFTRVRELLAGGSRARGREASRDRFDRPASRRSA